MTTVIFADDSEKCIPQSGGYYKGVLYCPLDCVSPDAPLKEGQIRCPSNCGIPPLVEHPDSGSLPYCKDPIVFEISMEKMLELLKEENDD